MPYCPGCGSQVVADARFCHRCGRSLAGTAAPTSPLPWLVTAGLAVALVVVLVVVLREGGPAPAASAPAAPFAGGSSSGAPPDLASMTPREAADRLFNRVLGAYENGDSATVQRFAPMALQAYGMVGPLDLDARLHVGMIQLASGDLSGALAQADSIASEAPTHLFATILRARASQRAGRSGDARAAYRAFLEHEAAERALQRGEYTEHKTMLDLFAAEARAAAAGQS